MTTIATRIRSILALLLAACTMSNAFSPAMSTSSSSRNERACAHYMSADDTVVKSWEEEESWAPMATSSRGSMASMLNVSPATKAAWRSVWSDEDWDRAAPKLKKARDVLASGGVIIAPSHVGYSLYTKDAPEGVQNIDRIKGRNKPIGLSGNIEAFRRVFGFSPPNLGNDYCSDLFLSLIGKASEISIGEESLARLQSSRAVGPRGETAMWLGGGPVTDYLADEMIKDGRFILVSSANVSGEGNPASDTYAIDAVDSAVRDAVDYVVDVPHWATPQLDEEGRWLSAPMFDLENMSFRRVGRHMTKARAVMSAFHLFEKIDEDSSGSISKEELKSYLKGKSFASTDFAIGSDQIDELFARIDADGSGEVEFGELLEFVDEVGGLNFGVEEPTYTKQELRKYLDGQPSFNTKGMSDEEFDLLFSQIDENGDGVVDPNEFFGYAATALILEDNAQMN